MPQPHYPIGCWRRSTDAIAGATAGHPRCTRSLGMSTSPLEARKAPALRRTLSVWQVSIAGVGVILGAGVYALVGPAGAHAGNALWLAFVVSGIAAGLTAFS